MSEADQKDQVRVYKRMLCGAVIGVIVSTVPLAIYFWVSGEFDKVPMFTMPPDLILMFIGMFGLILGALASLFSRKWNK